MDLQNRLYLTYKVVSGVELEYTFLLQVTVFTFYIQL